MFLNIKDIAILIDISENIENIIELHKPAAWMIKIDHKHKLDYSYSKFTFYHMLTRPF